MSELCPVAVPLEAPIEPKAETATEAFLSFLKKKRLCDVTFIFENAPDKIEAHQFCLRARSPVFDSMFRGMGSGTTTLEVKIEDASPETVDQFLQFVYGDKLDVTAAQAVHLLNLGDKYKVQLLVNKCAALIGKEISTENAVQVYEMAEKYELKHLRATAGDFIARLANFANDMISDPNMMNAKSTTLIALLKRSDLTVAEVDLFQLALEWSQNNSSGDHELALTLTETLLPFIRFTNMTPRELTTVVWPTNLLPPEDMLKVYAYVTGDDSTRNAILPSLKYETSCRKGKRKFKDIILFVSVPKRTLSLQQSEGTLPFREYISFSTFGIGSCEEGKEFKIRSVIVRWPTRSVQGKYFEQQPPVNFRVVVMVKHSSHELYATKFDSVVYGCSTDETLKTVDVEPPVEMSSNFDYCIAVVDEYSSNWNRRFTYHHGYYEMTPNLDDFSLENENFKLQIRNTKRNDFPKIYADKFQATKAGALDLRHLALKYKVEPLTKKCEALIKTEVKMEEALEVFETASRYEKRDLMEKAGDLLATHVDTLWPRLMEAQESTLNYLFRRDDLSVKECDLFTFLLKWGKNRPDGENDLKGVLKNLIYLVRYICMTPHEFTTNVVPTGLLSAEELVQIYSFFGSDPDVRSENGASMNFTVAPRQGEKEQRSVRFYSKPTQFWTCEGNKPLKECTSFTAKIGPQSSPSVWCEFSEKRPSITTLYIRWPSRAVENSDLKDENLNFKVALSSCVGPIRENNMEEIFSSMLAQCAGGEIAEINVEPPVELNNGTKYCITVEDLSAHASKLTTSSSTGTNPDPTASVRFTYCAPNKVNWIRNSSANLENWPAGLRDVEPSSNLTGFGNYGDLQLAVGLLLALV